MQNFERTNFFFDFKKEQRTSFSIKPKVYKTYVKGISYKVHLLNRKEKAIVLTDMFLAYDNIYCCWLC